jgi:hypothetical protein
MENLGFVGFIHVIFRTHLREIECAGTYRIGLVQNSFYTELL